MNNTDGAKLYLLEITKIITSFQFSPVSTMNIVIMAVYVSPKAYLASPPSSSRRGSAKNYLQSNAKINRKRKIKIPRFVISPKDPNTAPISTLSASQDLMILNIRRRRKALNMPRPPPPSPDSS